MFPLFIAHEMPVGLAGLIVAGIFAAAQSTVSTSMNSTATTVVTDFLKPLNVCQSDRGYLRAARLLTFAIGVAGTMIGLLFVNPEIKSLFDQFIKVIGLFMGVLGGLFVLGALTHRANGAGALVGALVGAGVMLWSLELHFDQRLPLYRDRHRDLCCGGLRGQPCCSIGSTRSDWTDDLYTSSRFVKEHDGHRAKATAVIGLP